MEYTVDFFLVAWQDIGNSFALASPCIAQVTMNNIILPVLCFYVVGPHRLNGTGVGFRFQLRRLVHAMILAFGVFSSWAFFEEMMGMDFLLYDLYDWGE